MGTIEPGVPGTGRVIAFKPGVEDTACNCSGVGVGGYGYGTNIGDGPPAVVNAAEFGATVNTPAEYGVLGVGIGIAGCGSSGERGGSVPLHSIS